MRMDDQGFTLETTWDPEPYLRQNQIERNAGVQQSDGMRKVGSIPPEIWKQWLQEDPELMQKPQAVLKKLHDPEWAYLRVVDKGKL